MYEAHRRYIDLHYTGSGTERIATADTDSLTVSTSYDEQKDIGFLTGEADGCYNVKPGQFLVCFPNDAHKVAMMADEPATVSKVVFKIAVKS